MTAPVWGRMRRGRVWHVCMPGDAFLIDVWCGEREPVAERVPATLPDGARACGACLAAVARFAEDVADQRQAPLIHTPKGTAA